MIPFRMHRRLPLVRRPFYQRDLAMAQRDTAIRERDEAIEQRDECMARLAEATRRLETKHPLDDLPPLYHSYALFNVHNKQLPGIYEKNQQSKQYIILAYIQWAIAKCKARIDDDVSFVELFCADGFYAMAAKHLGATVSFGIDNGKDQHSSLLTEISSRLGLEVGFREMDAADISGLEPVDIVANVGGLYHVADPEAILDKSYELARRFLVIQTVVSTSTNDPDYFCAPAPGWTWGSRYSRASFERMLAGKPWKVIDTHFNLLEGNDRPEDMGSCYALIEKPV